MSTPQEGKTEPSTTTKNSSGGGAYVPPHRRRRETAAGQADRVDTASIRSHDSTRFHSNNNNNSAGRARGGGRQEQRFRDRRGYNTNDSSSSSSWQYDKKRNRASSEQRRQHYLHSVPDFCIPRTRICCINLPARTDKWQSVQMEARRVGGDAFCRQIERFNAINGHQWRHDNATNNNDENLVQVEWDATQNAEWSHRVTPGLRTMTDGEVGCALSHVMLWKQLVNDDDNDVTTNMLILEDDCTFCARGKQTRFPRALEKTLQLLPEDWGILYLGFSSRGPRQFVNDASVESDTEGGDPIHDPPIRLYQPTYGFHTHAYMITKVAAERLLDSLPVTGPIDVWLADNQWFGIPTYCSVIANEGWFNEETEMYEGANLVGQKKWKLSSDVDQSAHT